MEERLVVKNFGPIKDMDIRIGKLTVLIGEQATGKSTLGKLLAVCKDFTSIQPDPLKLNYFWKGLVAYELADFLDEATEIEFENEDYYLQIKGFNMLQDNAQLSKEPTLFFDVFKVQPKSEGFKELFFSSQQIESDKKFAQNRWLVKKDFLESVVSSSLEEPFYIPAERILQSVFSLGQESLKDFPGLLIRQFAQLDSVSKAFENGVLIEPLNIFYHNQGGVGFFRENGKNYPYLALSTAASGYQSVVPIVLLLEYYTQIRKKKKTFIIEEPELNLFPTTQHRLMQYLVSNLNQTENQILITTHSPYILSALNNMLNAYKSGQIDKERTAAILPEKYWLNAKEVTAYRLMPDGTRKDLMNGELSMIRSEEIDEVSEELNQKFDQLVTIQLEAEHE